MNFRGGWLEGIGCAAVVRSDSIVIDLLSKLLEELVKFKGSRSAESLLEIQE